MLDSFFISCTLQKSNNNDCIAVGDIFCEINTFDVSATHNNLIRVSEKKEFVIRA